jgi:hypothetical protein
MAGLVPAIHAATPRPKTISSASRIALLALALLRRALVSARLTIGRIAHIPIFRKKIRRDDAKSLNSFGYFGVGRGAKGPGRRRGDACGAVR